jgi:hypothetical protein
MLVDHGLYPPPYTRARGAAHIAKLSKFDCLTPPQQMMVLRHYQGYVAFLHDHLQRARHYVATNPHIPEAERPYILRATEHRLRLAEADGAWVEAEIAGLAGQMDAEGAAAGPLRFTPKTHGIR